MELEMKLTIVAITVGVAAGLLAGGRLSHLGALRVRWSILVLVGLALQVLPVPGRALPMSLLFLSFALLLAFTVVNRRLPGLPLIILGLAMNLSVIAVNGGMPVTRAALIASGQQDTLDLLVRDGGAKHHLASPSDDLLPLADVIPVPGIHQAASAGDVATCGGVIWLIVWGMRRRSTDGAPVGTAALEEGVHVGA
jgi:hypothetical protein